MQPALQEHPDRVHLQVRAFTFHSRRGLHVLPEQVPQPLHDRVQGYQEVWQEGEDLLQTFLLDNNDNDDDDNNILVKNERFL